MKIERPLGHEREMGALFSMWQKGALPHALLFLGPNGIGKKGVAFYLAQAILCQGEKVPCKTCKSCRLFLEAAHPDFILIAAEKEKNSPIKIDQIRKMQAEIALSPYLSRRRVIIIDEAERLNEAASNSLLKTLEEPAGENYFILVSKDESTLLPTIISRCTKMRFSPLSAEVLTKILEKRQPGFSQEKIAAIAQLSFGSASSALELCQEEALLEREMAFSLWQKMRFFSDGQIWEETAKLLELSPEKLARVILFWQLFWRDVVAEKCFYNSDWAEKLLQSRLEWPPIYAQEAFSLSLELQKKLDSNANIKLALESFFLQVRALEHF